MIRLRKHIQILGILLALMCASISSCANLEGSDLFRAASDGDLFWVKMLIAAKADVNAKTADGTTALFIASQNGHPEVVQALIAAKADVNTEDDDGYTALIVATMNGHLDVVQLLKKAGAVE